MKRKRGGIVSQLLMILLVVVIIFPLYFMTANSFKTHEEYVNNRGEKDEHLSTIL